METVMSLKFRYEGLIDFMWMSISSFASLPGAA